MADTPPIEQSVHSGDTAEPGRARHDSALRGRPASGLATYYRLRTIALEARVAALEAELDRTERRLQETIQQYEDILQCRPEEQNVVTTRTPTTDDE